MLSLPSTPHPTTSRHMPDLLPASSNACFILIHSSFSAHDNLLGWYYYYFQFIPWAIKCKEAHVLGDTELEVQGQGFKLRKFAFQIQPSVTMNRQWRESLWSLGIPSALEGDWEHQESGKEGPRRREDASTVFPLALGWEPVLGDWPWTFSGKKTVCCLWFCLGADEESLPRKLSLCLPLSLLFFREVLVMKVTRLMPGD